MGERDVSGFFGGYVVGSISIIGDRIVWNVGMNEGVRRKVFGSICRRSDYLNFEIMRGGGMGGEYDLRNVGKI